MGRCWMLLVMLLLVGAGFPPQLELWVPAPPVPARVSGTDVLVYEIHLTNMQSNDMSLKMIQVHDGKGRSLGTFKEHQLQTMVKAAGSPGTDFPRRIGPGQRTVVYMWVEASPTPDELHHTLWVGQGGQPNEELRMPPVRVRREAALVLPLPFKRAGRWVAVNGPSNDSVHRRTVLTLDGHPWISQRFAIDWVMVDEGARTHQGDAQKNGSYYCYGAEALAVADATVAYVKDGIAENVPGSGRAVPMDLETVGGNTVALDLGEGRFAMYAHLQPGSLRVKAGDRVKAGQVLGLVGNSGNSSEPHLHFHVATSARWLAAEGLPYSLGAHDRLGVLRSDGLIDDVGAGMRPDDLPGEDGVVRVP